MKGCFPAFSPWFRLLGQTKRRFLWSLEGLTVALTALSSLVFHRDQREEELGEYYMKKYAKSSVGET